MKSQQVQGSFEYTSYPEVQEVSAQVASWHWLPGMERQPKLLPPHWPPEETTVAENLVRSWGGAATAGVGAAEIRSGGEFHDCKRTHPLKMCMQKQMSIS